MNESTVLLPAALLLLLLTHFAKSRIAILNDCEGTLNGRALTLDGSDLAKLRIWYQNCTFVHRNLELTHLNVDDDADLNIFNNVEEIRGNLFIYSVKAKVIRFPKLRVIHGDLQLSMVHAGARVSETGGYPDEVLEDYAMTIENSRIRFLEMPSLRLIGGKLKSLVQKNEGLCHLEHSIDWKQISTERVIFKDNGCEDTKYQCDDSCEVLQGSRHCWGPGKDLCQTLYRGEYCSSECESCFRNITSDQLECCDESCSSGCLDKFRCLDCSKYIMKDSGICVDQCPAFRIYDHVKGKLMSNPNGRYHFFNQCVKQCPINFFVENDQHCVFKCSTGYFPDVRTKKCFACPECRKDCIIEDGVRINYDILTRISGCKVIVGSIDIDSSIFESDTRFGRQISYQNLSMLDGIEKVTGFVSIQLPDTSDADGCDELIQSGFLYLKNLSEIVGSSLLHNNKYSLVIGQPDFAQTSYCPVHFVGLRSLKRIHHGMVFMEIESCFAYTLPWCRSDNDTNRILEYAVSDNVSCFGESGHVRLKHAALLCSKERAIRSCHSECRQSLGCWGGGPDFCFQCKNFKRAGLCESKCNLEDGYFVRFTENEQLCLACDPLCNSCAGSSLDQCTSCKYFLNERSGKCVERCHDKEFELDGKCVMCAQFCLRSTKTQVILACLLTLILTIIIVALVTTYFMREKIRLLLWRDKGEDIEMKLNPSAKPKTELVNLIKDFELIRKGKIGSGAFGVVYKGLYLPSSLGIKVPVALKQLYDTGKVSANIELIEEAQQMVPLRHKHLVRFIGICLAPVRRSRSSDKDPDSYRIENSSFTLIAELMPYGSLKTYIQNNENTIGSEHMIRWSYQIALGMEYLEDKRIVHCDLAARNVLLQSPSHVRISDFGMAKMIDYGQIAYTSTGGKVPYKWLALETMQHQTFTHKSDVWAYGITIWEIVTFCKLPLYDNAPCQELYKRLRAGDRLPQPLPVCTTDVYMTMIKCWMADPDGRPSFRQLAAEFKHMGEDPPRYLVVQGDKFKRLPQTSLDDELQALREMTIEQMKLGSPTKVGMPIKEHRLDSASSASGLESEFNARFVNPEEYFQFESQSFEPDEPREVFIADDRDHVSFRPMRSSIDSQRYCSDPLDRYNGQMASSTQCPLLRESSDRSDRDNYLVPISEQAHLVETGRSGRRSEDSGYYNDMLISGIEYYNGDAVEQPASISSKNRTPPAMVDNETYLLSNSALS